MEQFFGYYFKFINDKLKATADDGLSALGLTFAQSRVLAFLADRGGQATQKDIENFTRVSHPTVVGLVSRMEQNGFLSSSLDPNDKRNKIVCLTDKAKSAGEEIRASINETERKMLRSFTQEQKSELYKYLLMICSNIEKSCPPELSGKSQHSNSKE